MNTREFKTNPFSFGSTVTGHRFINRDEERKELIIDIQNHTNLIIYGPRRYGKTSLILQILHEMQQSFAEKLVWVYVDFYKVHSIEKFITLFAREFARNSGWTMEKILSFFKSVVSSVRPKISMDEQGKPELSISFTRTEVEKTLDEILTLPQVLAQKGYTVCIVFDEFQEISRLNGDAFQKELRAIIQHQTDVSYIFCGSKQHLMQYLFNRSNRPLYNIGKMKAVGKIPDEDFIQYLYSNMQSVKASFTRQNAQKIYRTADGLPYYVQLIAYECFNAFLFNQKSSFQNILTGVVDKIITEKEGEFLSRYEHLSMSQKKILDIVINEDGVKLFRKEILSAYEIPTATLKKGLTLLTESGILDRVKTRYVFQDVFFKQWLNTQ